MSTAQRLIRPEIQPNVRLFDARTKGKLTPRWLFFPGDVIVPKRKQQIDWLSLGGEETDSPCLQKYGRGFLPRGLTSLCEIGQMPMPQEQLANLGSDIWTGIDYEGSELNGGRKLGYVPVYPADGAHSIVRRSLDGKGGAGGIVEIEDLLGRDWPECHNDAGDGILDVIEMAFFGDGMEPTLRGLREQITHGQIKIDLGVDIGKIKAKKLLACDLFEEWAGEKVKEEETKLRQGVHPAGHIYTYSPLAELLLVQLERRRQDQPFNELAELNTQMGENIAKAIAGVAPAQSSGFSAEDMIEMGRKLALAEMQLAEANKKLADSESKRGPGRPKKEIVED